MAVTERNDALIQRDVLEEFAWDPEVELARVGVVVADGVVTLEGSVGSHAQKLAAERAAQRIRGVRAVANELDVEPAGTGARDDTAIARDAATALEGYPAIPRDQVRIAVADGRITLDGEVVWDFQRVAAERCLSHLAGVRAIANRITIKPIPASEAVVKEHIERALIRSAEVDAAAIRVHADGREVRLTGTVRSWTEKQAAEEAARKARGVARVVNDLVVETMDLTTETD